MEDKTTIGNPAFEKDSLIFFQSQGSRLWAHPLSQISLSLSLHFYLRCKSQNFEGAYETLQFVCKIFEVCADFWRVSLASFRRKGAHNPR